MSARMKPVNSAAGGSVEGQSLYGFRHFEPRFFQEGPQSRCGQMWFGKNLLNEHKFQAVSFFFFQHESERMCFTKLCQQWQWLSFLEKTTFRKIRRVIFVKGNPRRKSTYAKGCPFSSPQKKSDFQSFCFVNGGSLSLLNIPQQMESKFVSVPSCFKVPKINMKQKTTSCKKQLRSFFLFSSFSESFQWRVADFTLFSSSAFRTCLTLGISFFAWFAQRLLLSCVVLTPPKTMVVGRLPTFLSAWSLFQGAC